MDAPATCIISRVAIVLVGIIYTGCAWRNQNSASVVHPFKLAHDPESAFDTLRNLRTRRRILSRTIFLSPLRIKIELHITY